jgi:hypothetical protein
MVASEVVDEHHFVVVDVAEVLHVASDLHVGRIIVIIGAGAENVLGVAGIRPAFLLKLKGKEYPVKGLGVRDHGWVPSDWNAILSHR